MGPSDRELRLKAVQRWTRPPYGALGYRHKIKREGDMHSVFNGVMRIVSSVVGLAMIAMGTVWMLQGLNLAFRVGFMVGDIHWTFYGAILALVGVAQVIWSNTRQVKA
jgi:hypothetical protein